MSHNQRPEIKTNKNYTFNPYFSDTAKLEINVSEYGVSIVGNAEGYLALSRFCTYLADIHMLIRTKPLKTDTNTVDGYGGYHFSHYVTKYAIANQNYIFSPGPIKNLAKKDSTQDVLFWISDKIGPEFWKNENESCSTKEWFNNSIQMAFDSLTSEEE